MKRNSKKESIMRERKINNLIPKKKSYWLYLHPYVHLNIKKAHALIYNTINGKVHEYSGNTEVLKILKRLDIKKNLYVIKLKEDDLTIAIKKFINEIRNTYSGDFIDSSYSDGKPIQLKPIPDLNKKINESTYRYKISILKNDEIEEYLKVINIYINNECTQSCSLCKSAYKQFLYCTARGSQRGELSIFDIRRLLEGWNSCYKLNILGGNIFKHSKLMELTEFLNDLQYKKGYLLNYLNFEEKRDWLKLLGKDKTNALHIFIHFPLKKHIILKLINTLQKYSLIIRFHFVLEKGDDMTVIEKLITDYDLKDVEFHPYYNGKNLNFFKNNIFITKESLIETKPTLRNIFANRIINILNFRHLTVMSDKYIYANLNHSSLGQLGKDNIFDIFQKELLKGKSWARVRKNVSPCKGCVYNALCPPISNYEYTIGRYNLCNITK